MLWQNTVGSLTCTLRRWAQGANPVKPLRLSIFNSDSHKTRYYNVATDAEAQEIIDALTIQESKQLAKDFNLI